MIGAEVNLLDSSVQARIARILEIELSYIQNELKTVSTQVAVIATACFFAIMLNEPKSSHRSLDPKIQAVMISAASLTIVLSCLTLCSSMFLNMWGANDALRTKTVSMLTDAVSAVRSGFSIHFKLPFYFAIVCRRERISTLRLFTFSVVMFMVTGMLLSWLYWNAAAGILGTLVFTFGLVGVAYIYCRTKRLFKYACTCSLRSHLITLYLSHTGTHLQFLISLAITVNVATTGAELGMRVVYMLNNEEPSAALEFDKFENTSYHTAHSKQSTSIRSAHDPTLPIMESGSRSWLS